MSDERKLAVEDREKIHRLLISGTLENVTLALSLIEETAGQEDIADIFTMNVIVELICLNSPESVEVMVRAAHIILKYRKTWKVFSEAVVDASLLTSQRCQPLLESSSISDVFSHELEFATAISSAAAEHLMGQLDSGWTPPDHLNLSSIRFMSGAVAESLSKFNGELRLNALTDLTDAAAESLGQHQGKLSLKGLERLSETATENLVKHEGSLDLGGLTELSDAAAESLSKHKGDLSLYGLTSLSDAAAESLSEHGGNLWLDGLTGLSGGPGHIALAERLSKHEGDLHLHNLTELSDAAAESLINHRGSLGLNGLTTISDAAAESLSKHDGDLYLNGLTELSDTVAVQLASHNNLHISTKIKRQIKKAVSSRNQQARNSAKTGQTALTKKQSIKLRKLFRSKDADNVLIAVELIDASEATQDDISDVLSSSVLSLLVNTWDVRVWNALAPLLLSYPNAKREFTELANKRVQHQSSYGFIAGFYGEATKPLALLGLKIIDDTSRELGYLTSLSDAGAESLSKHEGHLSLSGLTELSDAAAESLSKHEDELNLSGLTSLSDGPGHIALAESLSKHGGYLNLYRLTVLSDAAAESLSKHEGELNLIRIKSLSDAAAESLSKHGDISLHGLTSLSDGPGHIALAESLSKQEGCLYLYNLTELSDGAAESLSKHEGRLDLSGLTELSDTAAQHLAKHSNLTINLDNLPASAAKILRDAGHGE